MGRPFETLSRHVQRLIQKQEPVVQVVAPPAVVEPVEEEFVAPARKLSTEEKRERRRLVRLGIHEGARMGEVYK